MPNDKNRIIDRLFNENYPELMPNELEQLLDAELAKPENEMDTQLISDLIDLMDIDAPSEAEKQADWETITRKIKMHRRRRAMPRMLRRIAAIAASIVAVFFVSLSSARAFNWTFLLKYLLPVAQTFGIVSSEYTIEDGQETEYWSEDAPDSQEVDFASLDALPSQFASDVVESDCIPAGYQFVQGSWFKSIELEKCSFYFEKTVRGENPEQWLIIEVMQMPEDKSTSFDVEFERQSVVPQTIQIDGIDVTLYYNSEDIGSNVSWLIGNTHYEVYGMISEEELAYIISSLHSYHQ